MARKNKGWCDSYVRLEDPVLDGSNLNFSHLENHGRPGESLN